MTSPAHPSSASTTADTVGHEPGTPKPTTPPSSPRPAGSRSLLEIGERYGLVVLLLAFIVFFGFLEPTTFLTVANFKAMALSQSVTIVLGLALMLPLVSGNFDLSIGAMAIMAAMVCAACMSRYGLPLIVALIAPVLLGLFVGLINGLLVTTARLTGLIATIGTATVLQALLIWYSGNLPIATGLHESLLAFGTGDVFGVPYLAIAALVLCLVVHYLLTQTPFGRQLIAIGSNPSAAKLVGVRVNRLVIASYALAGGFAGVAGVLMVAQQGSANPSSDGIGVLVSALTIVFLGATAFRPGEFNVPGMIVALLLAAVLVSGLTLAGVANWVSPLSYGIALIVGVGVAAYFRTKRLG